jgi:hypothetical protein
MAATLQIEVFSFVDTNHQLVGVLRRNAFILYDRNIVVAHAQLVGRFLGLSVEQPLPTL